MKTKLNRESEKTIQDYKSAKLNSEPKYPCIFGNVEFLKKCTELYDIYALLYSGENEGLVGIARSDTNVGVAHEIKLTSERFHKVFETGWYVKPHNDAYDKHFCEYEGILFTCLAERFGGTKVPEPKSEEEQRDDLLNEFIGLKYDFEKLKEEGFLSADSPRGIQLSSEKFHELFKECTKDMYEDGYGVCTATHAAETFYCLEKEAL